MILPLFLLVTEDWISNPNMTQILTKNTLIKTEQKNTMMNTETKSDTKMSPAMKNTWRSPSMRNIPKKSEKISI